MGQSRFIIALGLRSYTPRTIVDPRLLWKELENIRQRGYAIDDEEYSPGIRCVGAPIRNASGRVFASISVSGPTRRMTKAKMASASRLVVQYADAISAQLGYRPKQARAGAARTTPILLHSSEKLAQVVSVSPDGLGRVILSLQRSGKGKTPSFRSLMRMAREGVEGFFTGVSRVPQTRRNTALSVPGARLRRRSPPVRTACGRDVRPTS
jgi:hypothetical protein